MELHGSSDAKSTFAGRVTEMLVGVGVEERSVGRGAPDTVALHAASAHAHASAATGAATLFERKVTYTYL